MTIRASINDFLAQRTLAIVGISRNGGGFGNTVYKEIKQKGYQVLPVHPKAKTIQGDFCYPNLGDLPKKPGGVVIVVPPAQTEKIVKEAKQAGISRVWMQQGSESKAAIEFCKQEGISVVHGECILMFAEPIGFAHKLHRWLWGMLGKLPR